MPAYVGLGSNLDDPAAQLAMALEALAALPDTRLVALSGRYHNPPMGPQDQPDYLNAVAGLLTRLPAEALLAALQGIEDAQGRRREGPRWGPRTVDLDLLAYGNTRIESDALTLPHPGICSRPFVLVPLAEVAPGLHLPDGQSVAALAAAADATGLRREEP
ncbi:2-amino-4-hydroxy-6-hydroxymethyldihydropteridine diphosphokinase [Thioalkalivibrio sp. XN279]|uniref:2-amino-4-hydroxy-6- hydroxymethyldihydropteridine diphosphokinase n=1 Tax=Thioalkalivibrio sp. XN279 TaxID=2714953 RepID=UPI00140CABDF|nr:2-amino-4-hydroxy-6-hydroxymethyldihydropteridine diphosphokinase [Thioalkalivibrio sp. XN279]NHA14788.1 2-amino-4-hydroxy-6-hydroxymethyldihydropteridine diphosphokinase [Thioalkalivibrio sp. XN279]